MEGILLILLDRCIRFHQKQAQKPQIQFLDLQVYLQVQMEMLMVGIMLHTRFNRGGSLPIFH
ncbi:hypothetical protein A3N40_13810 [Enterobacter cloacae subsp. dissolvens]|nr:hypothetical protein A3N40_13810 [Enterobacter cloacae subsp. dissolvens]